MSAQRRSLPDSLSNKIKEELSFMDGINSTNEEYFTASIYWK